MRRQSDEEVEKNKEDSMTEWEEMMVSWTWRREKQEMFEMMKSQMKRQMKSEKEDKQTKKWTDQHNMKNNTYNPQIQKIKLKETIQLQR